MPDRLTDEMRAFLAALSEHDGPIGPTKLSVRAGYDQDLARQRCRLDGFAERVSVPVDGGHRKRWQITPAGREALAKASA